LMIGACNLVLSRFSGGQFKTRRKSKSTEFPICL
jgi:hypothetical protein